MHRIAPLTFVAVTILLLAGCGETERIITPNAQQDITEEVLNLRFTFDLDGHLLTIQNFNAAVVWVKVNRLVNSDPGGVLYNYFIWSGRTSTRAMGPLVSGDQVRGKVWYWDWEGSTFDLPYDADFLDFVVALGGLWPVSSEEFAFTVGP